METAVQGFRLSPQQRRIWLLQAPAAPARAQCVVVLEGALEETALQSACGGLVERWEILRTRFHRIPGIKIPIQVIAETSPPGWQSIELPAMEPAAQRAWLEQILLDQRQQAGDLDAGCVLCCCLARQSAQRHLLVLTLPALCADAWTLPLLVHELAALYAAEVGGGAAALEDPQELIQHVHFSEWQNELQGDAEAIEAREWAAKLEALPQPRFFFEQASREPREVDRCAVELPAALATAIAGFARDRGVSEQAVLLAAWQALLARLVGGAELSVAVGFDGRSQDELKGVFGPLGKYLPVSGRLSGAERFESVLAQAVQGLERAQQWQDYFAWDENVDAEKAGLALGLDYLQWPDLPVAAGVGFRVLSWRVAGERFKLHLMCTRRGEQLEVELGYEAGRFAPEAVAAVGEKLRRLLEAVVADATVAIADVDLMSEQERRQVLVELNATFQELPDSACLHELFAHRQQLTPTAVALEFEGEQMSYATLETRANRLAHYLRGLGVAPEVKVAVCLERSPELVVALLAVLKAGGAYVPLDPLYPPRRLAFLLEDTRAPVLITEKRWLDALPTGGVRIVAIDADAAAIAALPAVVETAAPSAGAGPDNLAYVLYTSGSTGRPKGVMVAHRGLVNYLEWSRRRYRLDTGTGALLHSPIGFDLSVTALWAPLLAGQRVVLVAEERGIEGLSMALAQGSDLSLVKLTPSHLDIVSELLPAERAAGCVRTMVVGGEALAGESLRFWRESSPSTVVVNEYGPTEAIVGCIAYEMPVDAPLAGPVRIGRPIANAKVYLVDERLRPVLAGVPGEALIGGAALARGYLARPAETARRFIPDPFSSEPGCRLYRTGDRMRLGIDGELEFLGRSDDQVKVRGYRIEPGEVEAALLACAGVREAVVVSREDKPGDRRLVAYAVLDPRAELAIEQLRGWLQDRLPEPLVPTAFVALDRLPLTPNGKVDRAALPEPQVTRAALEAVYEPPRTPIEEVLCAIWPQVLGVDRIGIDDNFFALGGDSLRSVRVIALAKQRGVFATVEQLFEHQTIRRLAQVATTQETGSLPPVRTRPFSLLREPDRALLPEGLEDAYPLTTMQAGMLYHMELDPDNPAYHNVNTWHLRAPFDPPTFLEAVEKVSARHPVLRTAFDLVSYSEPLQLVHVRAPIPVAVDDLRALPEPAKRAALEQHWASEARNVFDLSRPPYLRFHIHRRTDESFQFTLTESHAIMDGWSTSSTLAEVFEVYLGLLHDKPPRLDRPLATSFRDFVMMERQAIGSEEHRRFWADRLSGAVPTRLPRWPAGRRTAGETAFKKLYTDLPAEVVEGVRRVAHSVAVPFKTALTAAHVKAMSLATGRDEVLTGLVTNGRPEQLDGDRIRGVFFNTVPFRLQLTPGSWADLVREVFEAERELLPYRRYPISELQSQWGRTTLLEVAFTFLHFHSVESLLRTGEVAVLEDDERDLSFASFTLNVTFFLSPVSDNVRLILEYDASQLADEQMARLRDDYLRSLTAMAENPLVLHHTAPLLSTGEREELVAAAGTMRTSRPLEPVHRWFEAQAAKTPGEPAVVCGEAVLRYRELDVWATRLACELRRQGTGPERLVGLLLGRSIETLPAILGVLKAGAAYLPLDPDLPHERLALILADAGVGLVVAQRRRLERIDELPVRVLTLDGEPPAAAGDAQQAAELAASTIDLDNLAYAIYTSGSAGRPKASLITHRALANYLAWSVEAYDMAAGEGSLVHSPLTFDLTVTGLLGPLLIGRRVELVNEEGEIEALAEAWRRSAGLSLVKLTPGQLELLRQQISPQEAAGRARTLVLGGESLTAELTRFWEEHAPGTALVNEYGPTEATVGCVAYTIPARTGEPGELRSGPLPIGRPIANVRVYLLDRRLRPVPVAAPGILHVAGAGLARGYLGQPRLSAQLFLPDPLASEPGERIYCTGDLAVRLPDGELEYLGRFDNQVKVRGFRIELDEIAGALGRHASVREALALVREDEPGKPRLVAYAVAEQGQQPSVAELAAFMRSQLPGYMVPSAFVLMEAFPLTPNGKVDRRALPAPSTERPELAHAYLAPRGGLEELVAKVFEDVLPVTRVGIRDNFFDLGGDSLSLFRAYSKLTSALGRKFRLTRMFRHPTVESLALFLSGGDPRASAAGEVEERIGVLVAGKDALAQQRAKLRDLAR